MEGEPVGVHRVEVKKKRLNPWWVVRVALVCSGLALFAYITGLSFGTIVRCWDYEPSKYSWEIDKSVLATYQWCRDNRGWHFWALAWSTLPAAAALFGVFALAAMAYYDGDKKYLED